MQRYRHTFALWTIFICALAAPGHAEVHVEGSPAGVHVSAKQDSVADVLAAIATIFRVKYSSAIPLETRATGTYSGSLSTVLNSLLQNYDYVIERRQQAIEISVFRVHGTVPGLQPAGAFPSAANISH
jgi:hypothetical protein